MGESIELRARLGSLDPTDYLELAKLRARASLKNMERAISEGHCQSSDAAFWGAQQAQAEAAIAQATDLRQMSVKVGAIGRELATIRGSLQLELVPWLECIGESLREFVGDIRQRGLDEDLAASQLRVILNEGLSQIIESHKLGAQRLGEIAQHTDPQSGPGLNRDSVLDGIEGHLADLAQCFGAVARALGTEGQPVRALWATEAKLGKLMAHLEAGPVLALDESQWQALEDLLGRVANELGDLSQSIPDSPEFFQVLQGIMDQLEDLASSGRRATA